MRSILGVLLFAGIANAGPRDELPAKCTEKVEPKIHVEYRDGKRITVIETPIIICDKVPRPSVVYVAGAQPIHYVWEDIARDFTPLILTTVKKAPF